MYACCSRGGFLPPLTLARLLSLSHAHGYAIILAAYCCYRYYGYCYYCCCSWLPTSSCPRRPRRRRRVLARSRLCRNRDYGASVFSIVENLIDTRRRSFVISSSSFLFLFSSPLPTFFFFFFHFLFLLLLFPLLFVFHKIERSEDLGNTEQLDFQSCVHVCARAPSAATSILLRVRSVTNVATEHPPQDRGP